MYNGHGGKASPLMVYPEPAYKWCSNNEKNKIIHCGGEIFYFGQHEPSEKKKATGKNNNQGHEISHNAGKGKPADIKTFLPHEDMGKDKKGHQKQADVKGKGDNGHGRIQDHVSTAKGGEPVSNGSKGKFEFHVLKHQGIFFSGQGVKGIKSESTPGNEDNKGQPGQGPSYKGIGGMHVTDLLSSK